MNVLDWPFPLLSADCEREDLDVREDCRFVTRFPVGRPDFPRREIGALVGGRLWEKEWVVKAMSVSGVASRDVAFV